MKRSPRAVELRPRYVYRSPHAFSILCTSKSGRGKNGTGPHSVGPHSSG